MAVALDSNVFIYWFERNREFFDASVKLIERIYHGETGYCSTLVHTEIYRGNDMAFEAVASIQNLTFIPMDSQVAQLAGQLRYKHRIKAPDAIHLATAITAGAERFVTNDKTLARLEIPELRIELL